ncbi:hypothetical protein PX699_27110 [Sphingobium sp. H39-3-25]|uniref:hypothetical protein n=1 Tax=Sphingobium arseniciresistens TaxID=3030834 RepID=UPI0023B918C7|nr:hypothetical protein [Sphingobium arseniciresistens]
MNPAVEVLLQRLKASDDVVQSLADTGTDLAHGMVLWMIEEGGPAPGQAAVVLDELTTLHRREAAGETVEPAQWRAVRQKAVDLSEMPDVSTQRAGGIAEAAAWSVTQSKSILSDLLNALTNNAWKAGSESTGWTPADETNAHKVLSGFHAEGLVREQIPGRFAEVDPELSGRFVAQLDAANTAALAMPAKVLNTLQRLAHQDA